MNEGNLKWKEVLEQIAPYPSVEEIDRMWLAAAEKIEGKIIVLDDDPTGVQTVHSIPVYTSWDRDTLKQVLADESKLCYILTNSRALTSGETEKLHRQLATDLREVTAEKNLGFFLISRSDSTLRGHYPIETQTLYEELAADKVIDGEIITPFFLEGGRLTIDDVHYVKEDDVLIPAGQTEFAKDSTFGYRSSNLKKWVEEKTRGKYRARDVLSISLEQLRKIDIQGIVNELEKVTGFKKLVVNAVDYTDLKVFLIGLVDALSNGKRFLFRTAASFVQVAGGIKPKDLLTRETLYPHGKAQNCGLVVVGSYVQKTTKQLRALQKNQNMAFVEWDVSQAETDSRLNTEVERVIKSVEDAFSASRDACVYTSREFLGGATRGEGGEEDLVFSARVSEGLVRVVQGLKISPGFLVAKGGITSSDVGVKGLEVKRAMVMGQILPGVPVWELGPESRFPGLPYVVFPGNVGDEDALRRIVDILRGQ